MKKILRFPKAKNFSYLLFSALFLLTVFAFSKALKTTPTVSVAADKMNLFYIGIDNPITVAMAGVPAEKVKVSCENGEIEDLGNGHYNVRIKTVGNKIIKVEADGIASKEIEYRVKRIPDPTSMIGFLSGGAVSIGYFEHQKKITAQLMGWPIEEKCVVQGFVMTIQSKSADPVEVTNKGEYFNATSLSLLDVIQSGDVVYFDNIKCKCPGDPTSRKINAMVFKMR
ncbi:MAG: GldM family protein [Saprospiraceae bacterium]